MIRYVLTALLALGLTACASASRKTDLKVLGINALSSGNKASAQFKGLEFLADPLPGQLKNRVNIFYVHGIGWTENPEGDALATDFIAGIADAYGLTDYKQTVTSQCGSGGHSSQSGKAGARSAKAKSDNHMFITTPAETYFQTALAGSRLKMDRLVCMDKHTLLIDDLLEFSIYRVFWDDLFWSSLQYPHVGQDDDAGASKEIASLRRKYNRKFKDELVNFGFSDAVMYLGPAGTELRRAVQGAMCSAALDASGYGFSDQGDDLAYTDACKLASYKTLETNQFAFVTESLGSKIVFDVMQDSLTDGKDNVIDDMISGSEFFMLANQVALLSLNDLSNVPRAPVKQFESDKQPKIIAMSEVNDFLTYELIPFYQQLWKRSYRNNEITPNIYESSNNNGDAKSAAARAHMVKSIGFDIIDMRLEFADRLIPLLDDLVDPLQAHGGHMAERELVLYLLCGAQNAQLNSERCLAMEIQKELAAK